MNRFLEKEINDKAEDLQTLLNSCQTKEEAQIKLYNYFSIDGASEEENRLTLEIQGIPTKINLLISYHFKNE